MQSVTLEGECAKRESARLLPHTPEVPGMRWRTVDSLRNVHPTIVLNCTYSTPQSATAEGSRVANGVSNHDVKNEMLEYIYSSEIKSAPEYCRKYCFLPCSSDQPRVMRNAENLFLSASVFFFGTGGNTLNYVP